MIKNLKKDLPIYINGFAVGYLFIETNIKIIDCIMLLLAIFSFLKYGKNQIIK
jgi:hypothetical protein